MLIPHHHPPPQSILVLNDLELIKQVLIKNSREYERGELLWKLWS